MLFNFLTLQRIFCLSLNLFNSNMIGRGRLYLRLSTRFPIFHWSLITSTTFSSHSSQVSFGCSVILSIRKLLPQHISSNSSRSISLPETRFGSRMSSVNSFISDFILVISFLTDFISSSNLLRVYSRLFVIYMTLTEISPRRLIVTSLLDFVMSLSWYALGGSQVHHHQLILWMQVL